MRHTLHADKWWIPIGYQGIDYAAWEGRSEEGRGPATYFVTDFTEPPLLPDAERVAFLVGQLTRAQYAQQFDMLQSRPDVAPLSNPAWLRYVVTHGLRDVTGLEIEHEDGRIEPLRLTFEEGPQGRRVSDASYEAILPFSHVWVEGLASVIYRLSGRRF